MLFNFTMCQELPIDIHLEEICSKVLNTQTLFLKASPGSGKTTRLPPALLCHFSQKIIVLEPRRLAAKFAANRVAFELKTQIGEVVGYAFRFENKQGPETRLSFYTEGTFLRLLHSNPELKGIDVVILDEFHERHKETDVAWALLRKLQQTKRPDLKLVVMSATLDKKLFSDKFDFFEVETPIFPLETHYLEHSPVALNSSLEKKVYDALWKALDYDGDVLIFLPGMRDILKVKESITPLCSENNLHLFILHGDLSNEEQALVMQEGKRRKVILSTNIAESSLTIPGVRIVIDSGLFRESSFSPWTGLSHLETKRTSKASAIQRAGRAARTGAGHVFRLFSKHEFAERVEFEKPEIIRADLCETLLLLYSLGEDHVHSLPWTELPPEKSLESSQKLLKQLGAIAEDHLTEIGKSMSRFPLHPRLSRLLVEATFYSETKVKKMIQFISSLEEDTFLRKRLSDQLHTVMRNQEKKYFKNDLPIECLLLKGFVDRIGILKESKQKEILLCNGELLRLGRDLQNEVDPNHPLVIVIEVSPSREVTRLVPIEEEWLYEIEPFPIEEGIEPYWDEQKSELYLREELRIGQILLSEQKRSYKGEEVSLLLKEKIKVVLNQACEKLLREIHLKGRYQRLIHMGLMLNKKLDEFSLNSWLDERIGLYIKFDESHTQAFEEDYLLSLQNFLDPEGLINVQEYFPEKILLRDKRSLEIHYDENPWVEGYIQDFYGMNETPTIGKGRIPLVLHLLGPHKRPVQVTKDLVSFWKKTYKELYSELSRDYPRHHWPQNPESAPPLLLKRHLS